MAENRGDGGGDLYAILLVYMQKLKDDNENDADLCLGGKYVFLIIRYFFSKIFIDTFKVHLHFFVNFFTHTLKINVHFPGFPGQFFLEKSTGERKTFTGTFPSQFTCTFSRFTGSRKKKALDPSYPIERQRDESFHIYIYIP